MGMATVATPTATQVLVPAVPDVMTMPRDDTGLGHQHRSGCYANGPGGSRRRRRFALLMAGHDSDYVRDTYRGYYYVFVDAFGDGAGADRWDMYRVVDGEFPRQDELCLYDGFVISGSRSDAHGSEGWVLQLCGLVRDLFFRERKRVLGVCFGHQVICRALGGDVRRARNGWDIGITDVMVAAKEAAPAGKRSACWFLDDVLAGGGDGGSSRAPFRAPIVQVHQDEVWELPPGAEVLARSDRTGVEMFHVDGRLLGIQGHPEYSKDILGDIAGRLIRNGVIQGALADEAKKRLAAGEPNRRFWLRLCRSFLEGPQHQWQPTGGDAAS